MARKILLVDDEPDFVENCARALRPRGCACLRAGTGPDAIVLIDREVPDLVVTDLRLPGVDGLAVARHARARVPPIAVLLISADYSDEAQNWAKAAGVSAFLAKPVANIAFQEAVERLLAGMAAGSLDGVARSTSRFDPSVRFGSA